MANGFYRLGSVPSRELGVEVDFHDCFHTRPVTPGGYSSVIEEYGDARDALCDHLETVIEHVEYNASSESDVVLGVALLPGGCGDMPMRDMVRGWPRRPPFEPEAAFEALTNPLEAQLLVQDSLCEIFR